MDDPQKPGHPDEIKAYDLTKRPQDVRRGGGIAPPMTAAISKDRTPEELMVSLGFEPNRYITPLQFLIAVFNDDLDIVYRNPTRRRQIESKGGIGIGFRLEAAKTAARYMHMEMPRIAALVDKTKDRGKFGDGLSGAIADGNRRVRTRRTIIEEVERESPDTPLPPAQYPPNFQAAIEAGVFQDDNNGD